MSTVDTMQHEELKSTVQQLAENAAKIKRKVAEGNLEESSKLVGERIALVETLRRLRDTKVSQVDSDIKDEMDLLVRNMKNDVSDAIGTINARLLRLSSELAKVSGARKIAAYKISQRSHFGARRTSWL